MIISMTGYSNIDCENDKISFSMELKTINSKYFESNLKIPQLFSSQENKIMNYIKDSVVRGRVNFNLSYQLKDSETSSFKLDKSKLNKYLGVLSEIKENANIKDAILLENILSFQDLIIPDRTIKDKSILELLHSGLEKLVLDHCNFRKKEGFNIQKDILKSIEGINKNIHEIEDLWNKQKENYFDKYKNKIDKIVDTYKLDDQRLLQEIAIILDKRDINEEIVRFKSHIDFFISYIKDYDLLGKRLNFLIQELFREINTIASKSEVIEINRLVLDTKTELEKIKEQIQNIL